MSTPLADRIRAKAQQAKSAPATPMGATGAMAKQAAVSSTGKAAPVTGGAQSNIAETMAASQAQTQADAQAGAMQQAAEDMAVTEQAADVKQQGFESQQRQAKLQADNEFNNKLAQFSSRVKMSQDKNEADRAALELKSELQRTRLGNERYKQALQDKGRKSRMQSAEDFAIAMSGRKKEESKQENDHARKMKAAREQYKRDSDRQVSDDDIATALKNAGREAHAAEQGAIVGGLSSMAGMAIDNKDSIMKWWNEPGFDADDTTGQGKYPMQSPTKQTDTTGNLDFDPLKY